MSYSPSTNPPHAATQGGLSSNLPQLWIYVSTDQNLAAGYFTDGQTRGMKVNDLIYALDTTTPQTNMHRVTALAAIDPAHPNAIRAATISAGVKVSN